jgi:hypothetical protein
MSRQGGAKLKYKEKVPPRREFADMVLPRTDGSSPSHAKPTKTNEDIGGDEGTLKLVATAPRSSVAKTLKKSQPESSPLPKPAVAPVAPPPKEQTDKEHVKAKAATLKKKKIKNPTIKEADTVLTQPPPKSVRVEQARIKTQARAKSNNIVLILALIGMVVMASVVLTPVLRAKFAPEGDRPVSLVDRDGLEQFVNFHRHETGMKLNTERIGVEIENAITAPSLGYDAKKVPAPNMLNGLPLAGETFAPSVERPDARVEQTNPDFPDARTEYNLQEQQDEAEWERRAQKQYVDEFVANAQRAGYRVKIDKYGRVTVLGRTPVAPPPRVDEDGDPMPAFPGAIR